MNNSNNINICEKCGATNPITAKFCLKCGEELKAPDQPVICDSCNTANNPNARFCKFCGKTLYEGDGPQKCPRCGNTLSATAVVCDKCHHRMPIKEQPVPQEPLQPLQEKEQPQEKFEASQIQAQQPEPTKKRSIKNTIGSLVLCVMFFLLTYLLLGWKAITPAGLLSSGMFDMRMGSFGNTSGMQIVSRLLDGTFSIFDIINLVVIVPSLLTAIVGFISNLIKVLVGKQSKGFGYWYVLSAVCIGFVDILIWIICKFDFAIDLLGVTKDTAGNGALAYITPSVFLAAFVITVVFAKKEDKRKIKSITRETTKN